MSASITSSQIATPEAPWLGLRSFTEDAQDYFFGRQAELEDLYERILDKPLTILFGQSGLGKSSLLQAALIPRLRAGGFLPVLVRFNHDADAASLEDQMIEQLKEALTAAECHKQVAALITAMEGATPSGWDPAAFLWLLFHDPTYGFIPRPGESAPSSLRPVFLIDQFEEIFTLGERADRRLVSLTFRDAFASLIENRPPASLRRRLEEDDELVEQLVYQARHTRALLSLREDFLHVLERWQRSMPSLMENRFELRMLSGPQAFDAVVCPGQLRSAVPPIIPDEVGEAIVRFVAGAKNDVPLAEIDAVPPLLSLVCAELNAQRVSAGEQQVTRAQFEGHSDEILQSFYLRSFDLASYGGTLDGVPDAAVALKAAKRLIEDRLLSPDGYRESIAFDTIVRDLSKAATPDAAKAVLDEIVARRLLTVEERGGVRRLELAHDVLTPVAKFSRDERQEKEALVNAKRDQERAETEARQALEARNRLRRLAIAAAICALIAAMAGAFGIVGMVKAKRAAKEADSAFDTARDTVDNFLTRIEDANLTYIPGIQSVRDELSKKAIQQFALLRTKRPNDEKVLLGFLKAKASQATITSQVGGYRLALSQFDRCLLEIDESLGSRPRNQQLLLLSAATEFAYLRFLYKNDESPDLERMAKVMRRLDGVVDNALKPQARLLLAKACNLEANFFDDPTKKVEGYERSRRICQALLNDRPNDADTLLALAAATGNLGNTYRWADIPDGKEKISELLNAAQDYCEAALKIHPHSPVFLSDLMLGHMQRANYLSSVGKVEEAKKFFEDSVALCRGTAASNPDVTAYQWQLADTLKEYGNFLARRKSVEEARAVYEESLQTLEVLVSKQDDRPHYAAALLEMYAVLAQFEQGDASNLNEEFLAAFKGPGRSRSLRVKAIEHGRKMVKTYPNSLKLHKLLADLLIAESAQMAVPEKATALREALNLCRQHFGKIAQVKDLPAAQYFRAAVMVDDVLRESLAAAESKKAEAELVRLRLERRTELDAAMAALPIGKRDMDVNLREQMSKLVKIRASMAVAEGKLDEAAGLHRLLLETIREDIIIKPFFWFNRQLIAEHYAELANLLEKTGELREEITVRLEYLRIWGTPQLGAATEGEAKNEGTLAQALKLRELIAQLPELKKVVLACDVNGKQVNVQFWPSYNIPGTTGDPMLNDQLLWLTRERGVMLTQEAAAAVRIATEKARTAQKRFADVLDGFASKAENRVTSQGARKNAPEITDYFSWLSLLENALPEYNRINSTEKKDWTSPAPFEEALSLTPTKHDPIFLARLSAAVAARADSLSTEGKTDTAIELLERYEGTLAQELRNGPYKWPLKRSLADLRSRLITQFAKKGDQVREETMLQRWFEEWGVPQLGVVPKMVEKQVGETNEDRSNRLRELLAKPPVTKGFIFPCRLNGYEVKVAIFVSDAIPDDRGNPMFNEQVRWLKDDLGLVVPADIRDSMKKLAEIAKENAVSLVELATYALKYPTLEKATSTAPPAQTTP